MTTAIDTNVLLDILLPDQEFADAAVQAIENAAQSGTLVICDMVYAELCIHFSAQRDCDSFLSENGIRVEALSRESHFLASRVWRKYRQQGGKRTRILADFLIGAHGQLQAQRFISRDRGFYRQLFPNLKLSDPSVQ